MKERVVRFGSGAALVGILTEPQKADDRDRPAVILLNSGILHRVGACRLHVRIARALAPLGVTVLRFDYSGIGDSEARRDSLSFEESAVIETREAMDYLAQARGLRNFVLMGLCSGADMAFEVANVDPRVVGLVQLDAWAYRTFRHYLHHYGPRMKELSVWTNFIKTRLKRLAGRAAAPEQPTEDMELPTYVREFPPRERVAAELRALAERGMEFFYIYSGGQEEYNYRAQFVDMFREVDFKRQLRVDYLPDADHIFTGLDHQQLVVRGVVDWMRRFEGTPVMEPAREEVPGAVVLSKTPQRSRSHSGVGTGAGAAAL
jgi:pimeloyl-ACP methyl ester carboxylesterase